jgi:hypothetical protein
MLADPSGGPRKPRADLLIPLLWDSAGCPAQRFSVSELVT